MESVRLRTALSWPRSGKSQIIALKRKIPDSVRLLPLFCRDVRLPMIHARKLLHQNIKAGRRHRCVFPERPSELNRPRKISAPGAIAKSHQRFFDATHCVRTKERIMTGPRPPKICHSCHRTLPQAATRCLWCATPRRSSFGHPAGMPHCAPVPQIKGIGGMIWP